MSRRPIEDLAAIQRKRSFGRRFSHVTDRCARRKLDTDRRGQWMRIVNRRRMNYDCIRITISNARPKPDKIYNVNSLKTAFIWTPSRMLQRTADTSGSCTANDLRRMSEVASSTSGVLWSNTNPSTKITSSCGFRCAMDQFWAKFSTSKLQTTKKRYCHWTECQQIWSFLYVRLLETKRDCDLECQR